MSDDFLNEFSFTDSEASNFESNPQEQQNSYGNNNNSYSNNNSGGNNYSNNSSGNYNNNNSGGWKEKSKEAWRKKQQEIQEPYLPIVVYIDRDFPPEIKENLIGLISKLISKGFTVRFNGDDREIFNKITSMSREKVEAHIPFRDYKPNKDDTEGLQSKFCWNSKTTDHIAQQNFPAWDSLKSKLVKILLSRNVRMLIGGNNNSPAKFLITWSPDGASNATEVSSNTGNVGTLIRTADKLAVPVFNLNNASSRELLGKYIFKGDV